LDVIPRFDGRFSLVRVEAGKITVLAVLKERPAPDAVCEVSELIDAADGGAAAMLARRSR
jgi:hypothetical protein